MMEPQPEPGGQKTPEILRLPLSTTRVGVAVAVNVESEPKYTDATPSAPPSQMEMEERRPSSKLFFMGHDRNKAQISQDVEVEAEDYAMRTRFSDFIGLDKDVIRGLTLCRYDMPTPIQMMAIPKGIMGRDLLLQAKSGTGKTCVFTVCILQQVDSEDPSLQALVITSCREVAVQITSVIKSIGTFKKGLVVKEFIGGTNVGQSERRSKRCNIAVGTPGRLAHMIKDGNMDLSRLKVVAMDEADKLLEGAFIRDMRLIFDALPKPSQMITASATYSPGALEALEDVIKNPYQVRLNVENLALVSVDQYMVDVRKMFGKKREGVPASTTMEDECFNKKFFCLKELMRKIRYTQVIVFSNYQLRAEKIFDTIKALGWDVDYLSAARCQEFRLTAFTALKEGTIKILVATDVACRGIDIDGVDMVINFDVPIDQTTYMHRIGRSGRFGSNGRAFTLCYFDNEKNLFGSFKTNNDSTLWVLSDLEEIKGVNDKRKEEHTRTIMTSLEDDPLFQSGRDPEYEESRKKWMLWNFDQTLEDDCIHNWMGDEGGWQPKINFEDIASNIETSMTEFQKELDKAKEKKKKEKEEAKESERIRKMEEELKKVNLEDGAEPKVKKENFIYFEYDEETCYSSDEEY